MIKLISLSLFFGVLVFSKTTSTDGNISKDWSMQSSLYEILTDLGASKYKHEMMPTDIQIQQGEELVKIGRTAIGRKKKSKYISKYYTCISCHNTLQEDPDLRFSDPETRLPYVKKMNIPFLQGTTFKGIVNRESWYNDDYVKKYGDEKIQIAHQDLRESIQLCAIECSQGRPMEVWEIDAVLAYYWSLAYRLEDLDFSEEHLGHLKTLAADKNLHIELIDWLKEFYLQKSPANFYDAPKDKKVGYEGLIGNPDRGEDLYNLSCLYCHNDGGVSHYILDNNPLSYIDLYKNIAKNSHFSLYQIIAYGTYAIPGHRPYMPHYPKERMSPQQVEDLRAFITLQVKASTFSQN